MQFFGYAITTLWVCLDTKFRVYPVKPFEDIVQRRSTETIFKLQGFGFKGGQNPKAWQVPIPTLNQHNKGRQETRSIFDGSANMNPLYRLIYFVVSHGPIGNKTPREVIPRIVPWTMADIYGSNL
ncbi:hypothetical protein CAPTEDRAFT_213029 [Capitella teleta]|uniref:Uncharacterized protein n=1 Tax=Capitella teleta TaxID=283909 RepID=R7UK77_CAPTE|nr:hypothetical protein CAPTEDRAFT_213029 [Capitella teleta]|eukprot:ELU06580.1 hypothetical protein CAPTEDRAFT_213029 [Capitella teleta]